MAPPKRPKSLQRGTQKQAAAKQAAQKKLKDRSSRALKFRNEELRTMLDGETSTVYSVRFFSIWSDYHPFNTLLVSVTDDQKLKI
jgi:hypothetical protein